MLLWSKCSFSDLQLDYLQEYSALGAVLCSKFGAHAFILFSLGIAAFRLYVIYRAAYRMCIGVNGKVA